MTLRDQYLPLPQAAAYLGRSARWLRRRLSVIPHYRDGQISFTKESLDRYMATKLVVPVRPVMKPDLDEILADIDMTSRRRRAVKPHSRKG